MVEQQPNMFRKVNNDVDSDAIEECMAVCSSLGRLMPHSHDGGVLGQGGR